MEDPKPCPFCGGEASIKIHDYCDGARLYTPKCKCGAGLLGVFYTEEEAIAAWNNRYERTCHIIEDGYIDDPAVCNYCGEHYDGGRYCRYCGARVVSDEEQGHMVADAIRRWEKAVGHNGA